MLAALYGDLKHILQHNTVPTQEEEEVEFEELEKLPVTVLSGFLGAGKTTLLNYILNHQKEYKIAVIVNDMAELNIDSKLIQEGSSGVLVTQTEEKLVELSNGCICCTLREDLIKEVKRLAKLKRFDYLLIENTGIGEPLAVAQSFLETSINNSLDKFSRLDTLVTVVDGANFLDDQASGQTLLERKLQAHEKDQRDISTLLVDQIEVANVIILNKIDLITEEDRVKLRRALTSVNPSATILEAEYGVVDLKYLLNNKKFDFKQLTQNPGWLQALANESSETEEYGISSFVYRRRRPFHPDRLVELLSNKMKHTVIRSKGFFWLACDHDKYYEWATAGAIARFFPKNYWGAYFKENKMVEFDASQLKEWEEPYGDRRIEIVFIGMDLNPDQISTELDSAIITDEEMAQPETWSSLKNPFL